MAPHRAPASVFPAATAAEAAAIAAAIACFAADTARAPGAQAPTGSAWLRAALLEGTGREPDAPSPWGDPVPWR